MELKQDQLNKILREVKNLPSDQLNRVLLNANMTDYDLECLTDMYDDIEEHFNSEFDIREWIKSSSDNPSVILSEVFLGLDINKLETEDIYKALEYADLEDSMTVLGLYKFKDLEPDAQKLAIKSAKSELCKDVKMTNDEIRIELSEDENDRYLFNGTLFEDERFGL